MYASYVAYADFVWIMKKIETFEILQADEQLGFR